MLLLATIAEAVPERAYWCGFCDELIPPGTGIVVYLPERNGRQSIHAIHGAHSRVCIRWPGDRRLLAEPAQAERIAAGVAATRAEGESWGAISAEQGVSRGTAQRAFYSLPINPTARATATR